MQSERKPLKPYLLDLIAAGLEAAASPFEPEALKRKTLEMAKLGVAEFRVMPTLALDVRNTRAAVAGVKYLEKEGLSCQWQDVPALPDAANNPGGLPGSCYQLVVQVKAQQPS